MARLSDIRLRRSAVSGSIPSTSNLNLGELALNTADGKVYMKKSVGGTDSVVEIGASGGGISATFTAYEFTATSNQTTFSGSDNYSNTLAYNTGTPPKVQVFMNGILLDEGSSADYTGTNGTSIVLTTGADTGDLVQIHAYKSDVSVVSNLSLSDNQKIQFGNDQDLQIYHDGSQSIIQDVGTGQLKILGENTIHIGSATGSHSYIRALKSGAVELYHNNAKKFETTASGVQIQGSIAATTAAYLPIIYGGSSSLQLKSNTGELFAQFTNNSGAQLYHDNSSKLSTTSLGIDVTGEVQADSLDIDGLSVLTSNNNATPLTLERANATSNQVGIQFSAGNSRYFGKGTDHEPYWATSANLTAGSKIVTAGNFTGILDSTYYQSGDNISVGTISAGVFTTNANTGTFSNSIGTFPLVTSTPYDYVAKFESTDSGAAIIIEDNNSTNNGNRVSVNGDTMSFFTAATSALTLDASQNATFAGTISSTGMTVNSRTTYGSGGFFDNASNGNNVGIKTGGDHLFLTDGNGGVADGTKDIGISTRRVRNIHMSGTLTSGTISSGNITTTGYLRGPSTFTIDPAAHGDDTGTVVIAGNLQIDGTTTTINSTTLTVDDKNITLASGSANAAAANGAGLTVDGASATLTYVSTGDKWSLNKPLDVLFAGDDGVKIESSDNHSSLFIDSHTAYGQYIRFTENNANKYWINSASGKLVFRPAGTSTVTSQVVFDASGNVGIGTNSPANKLHVKAGASGATTFDSRYNTIIEDDGENYLALYTPNNSFSGVRFLNADSSIRGHIDYYHGTQGDKFIMYSQNGFAFQYPSVGLQQEFKSNGNVNLGATHSGFSGWRVLNIRQSSTGGMVNFDEDDGTRAFTFANQGVGMRYQAHITGGYHRFETHAMGAGTAMMITDAGNVGIGTASPDAKLRIDQNVGTVGLKVTGGSGGTNIAEFIRDVGATTSVAISGESARPQMKFTSTGNTFALGVNSNTFEIADNAVLGTNTRFVIDNAGNVGIGTAGPTALLHVKKDVDSFIMKVENDGNSPGTNGASYADASDGLWVDTRWNTATNTPFKVTSNSGNTPMMIIKGNGNVGIGNSNPSAPLDVAGIVRISESSNTAFYGGDYVRLFGSQAFRFLNTGGGTKALISMNGNSYFNGGNVGIGITSPMSQLHVNKDTSGHNTDGITLGKVEANGWIDTNEEMGRLSWAASYGSSFTPAIGAYISAKADANWNGNEAPTRLGFFTAPENSLTPVERLRIDKDGKVGIGTTAPGSFVESSRLVVGSGTSGTNEMMFLYSGTNTFGALGFADGTSGTEAYRGIMGYDHNTDTMFFSTAGGGNASRDVIIGSNGGVSIGTTTAAGSGGLLVDNDIKSNSRFGVGSGGSLSDAAIYKNSDTNTGIYWPGADQIALTTAGSSRLYINSTGGVSLGTQSQLTTGGNARLSIIDSSVQLSMGASNSDMAYIRKQGAGQFAWQTYNSGNSGMLQLQPYGGNVAINTTAAVSGHALSVSGKIGGLTYVGSYVQFTGGNTILKANDDVVIGYSSYVYVKQAGKVGLGTSDPKAEFQVYHAGIDTYAVNTSATSAAQVDTFSATEFRSARFTVQITNTTDSTYQITEILLIHDGTTPSMTEYSTIFTGSAREASFDADIVSGNVRLLATPASTDSMQFKVVRHSILV